MARSLTAAPPSRAFPIEWLEAAWELDLWGRGALGWAYGKSGRESEARTIARELVEQRSRGPSLGFAIAMVHLGLGDTDGAFEWLEIAYGERDGRVLLISTSPLWDGLRHDSRFTSLLERMGLS